jgi:hypothetical protein
MAKEPVETPTYGLIDRVSLKQKIDHHHEFRLWNVLSVFTYEGGLPLAKI